LSRRSTKVNTGGVHPARWGAIEWSVNMSDTEGFPVLTAGGVVKSLPDLCRGDLVQIGGNVLGDVDIGQLVVIHPSEEAGSGPSFILTDDVVGRDTSADVGARVAEVADATVTLEVVASADDSSPE
jgi:hypothetical protein